MECGRPTITVGTFHPGNERGRLPLNGITAGLALPLTGIEIGSDIRITESPEADTAFDKPFRDG